MSANACGRISFARKTITPSTRAAPRDGSRSSCSSRLSSPSLAARSSEPLNVLRRWAIGFTLLLVAAHSAACHYFPDHYLVHPHQRPGGIITWSERIAVRSLLVHLEGAQPRGHGPFPTVLVHP